jgi:hypothetical protein
MHKPSYRATRIVAQPPEFLRKSPFLRKATIDGFAQELNKN